MIREEVCRILRILQNSPVPDMSGQTRGNSCEVHNRDPLCTNARGDDALVYQGQVKQSRSFFKVVAMS